MGIMVAGSLLGFPPYSFSVVFPFGCSDGST